MHFHDSAHHYVDEYCVLTADFQIRYPHKQGHLKLRYIGKRVANSKADGVPVGDFVPISVTIHANFAIQTSKRLLARY